MKNPNNRVSLRDFIDQRFNAQDRLIDQRFNAQDKRLDVILPDHEKRIRTLEGREPRRTITEIVTAIVAVVAAILGVRQTS